MTIKLSKQIPQNAVLVLLVKEGQSLASHPFFKSLEKGDREYLSNLEKKVLLKAGYADYLIAPSKIGILLVVVAGKEKFNHRKAVLAARQIIASARSFRIKHLAVNFEDFITKTTSGERGILGQILATQFEIANFEFVAHKTPPPEGWFFVETVAVISPQTDTAMERALKEGKIIGEEINKARILSNTPGGEMTPKKLAEAAQKSGRESGFRVRVLDEKKMRQLKMGAVLGVAQGSEEQPRFIVMEYFRGRKNEKPVVIVGKGVTFDTGGLNLKPSEHIYEMHMDMSGGAATIHTLAASARLGVKKNIVGLVPAVENMPSGSSYRPGDLLKTMSGKTIEVLNTDAEGRVILADALEYAKRYKPRLVVDVATLTGAAIAALGQRASAIFATDPAIEKKLRDAGEITHDFVWPLPLWEEYEEEVKGTFGDVANVGKTRYGGAITGAVFLWQFIKDPSSPSGQAYPWVHIDIVPRMTTIEGEFLAKGAAGAPIALLAQFLREF